MFIRNGRYVALQGAHAAGIVYFFGYRFKGRMKMLVGFDDQNLFETGIDTKFRENIRGHSLSSILAQNYIDTVFR